jgi:hypothetical protein
MPRRFAGALLAALACAGWVQPAHARWTHARLLPDGTGSSVAVAPNGAVALAGLAETRASRIVRIVPGRRPETARMPRFPFVEGVNQTPLVAVSNRGRVVVGMPSLERGEYRRTRLRALLWEPGGARRRQTVESDFGVDGHASDAAVAMTPGGTALLGWNRLGTRRAYASTASAGHGFGAAQLVDDDALLFDLRFVRRRPLVSLVRFGEEGDQVRVAAADPSGRFAPSSDVLDLPRYAWDAVATGPGGAQAIAYSIGEPSRAYVVVRARDGTLGEPMPVPSSVYAMAMSATGRIYVVWGGDGSALFAATRAPGSHHFKRLGRVARAVDSFDLSVDSRGTAFVAIERPSARGYDHGSVETVSVARAGRRFSREHPLARGACSAPDLATAGARTVVAWGCLRSSYIARWRR